MYICIEENLWKNISENNIIAISYVGPYINICIYWASGGSMGEKPWWATVHGPTKSQSQLSTRAYTFINI